LDEVDYFFQRSYESLKSAEIMLKNECYSASINRSYYAVFYVARALLLKKGKNPKTHSGTIFEFGFEYIVNDKFDREVGKILSELEDDRGDADYNSAFESTEEIASSNLIDAKIFVEECEKFL
jgi:uncharacterized protein (UPF0332 family)